MNLLALLNEISGKEGLRFLMIGGLAVNAYGYSRVIMAWTFLQVAMIASIGWRHWALVATRFSMTVVASCDLHHLAAPSGHST